MATLSAENKYNLPKEILAKDFIWEFESSLLFLEDNCLFPWVILVPKKEVKNMLGLTTNERLLLMKEMETVERMVDALFNPFQINIAMFGNKVPRLHVHIIARFEGDATFPSTAFHAEPLPYKIPQKLEVTKKILQYLHFNT